MYTLLLLLGLSSTPSFSKCDVLTEKAEAAEDIYYDAKDNWKDPTTTWMLERVYGNDARTARRKAMRCILRVARERRKARND